MESNARADPECMGLDCAGCREAIVELDEICVNPSGLLKLASRAIRRSWGSSHKSLLFKDTIVNIKQVLVIMTMMPSTS